jgi:transcriptional regulator with XRE-family HTH domain
MLYRARLETGLTQDELAALAGESRRQVHRRESNKVHLGALRALVVLERAAKLKGSK